MKSETLAQYAKKLTKFSSAKQNFCIASRKMNTYTIGEAGTTDSDCHFSLFGQGRSPPRTRLRPSNKRRNFNEGQEIQRIGFCRQHLQVRWQSSGRKGHSVWLTARAGDVRRERHAGHADCKRRGLQRRGVHCHRHGASHSGGHVSRRHRHAYPALSHLAHRAPGFLS